MYCGEKTPGRRKYCNQKCNRHYRIYRIKALQKPDDWVECAHCGELMPYWAELERIKNRENALHLYCCRACRYKGVARYRKADPRYNDNGTPRGPQGRPAINRAEQCMRKLGPFDLTRCARYLTCDFKICRGWQDPKREGAKGVVRAINYEG